MLAPSGRAICGSAAYPCRASSAWPALPSAERAEKAVALTLAAAPRFVGVSANPRLVHCRVRPPHAPPFTRAGTTLRAPPAPCVHCNGTDEARSARRSRACAAAGRDDGAPRSARARLHDPRDVQAADHGAAGLPARALRSPRSPRGAARCVRRLRTAAADRRPWKAGGVAVEV